MGIQLSGARCEEIKRTVVSFFEKYDVACVPISGFEIAVKKLYEYGAIDYATFEKINKRGGEFFE